MSGEIQVKRNNKGYVVFYAPTKRDVTTPIITKGYAEDLARNAQYHLENYTWIRCSHNGYLEYSDRACLECQGRRWGFIPKLIEEGVLPDVVETKHCACLLLTPSPVCSEGQELHKQAETANTIDAWQAYVDHVTGDDQP